MLLSPLAVDPPQLQQLWDTAVDRSRGGVMRSHTTGTDAEPLVVPFLPWCFRGSEYVVKATPDQRMLRWSGGFSLRGTPESQWWFPY